LFCANTKSACGNPGIEFPDENAVLDSVEWRNLMARIVKSGDHPLNSMNILGGHTLTYDCLTPLLYLSST
jgi:hypothetical protein